MKVHIPHKRRGIIDVFSDLESTKGHKSDICISVLQRNRINTVCVCIYIYNIYKDICYKELTYNIMKAKKSHNLLSRSWRPRNTRKSLMV